MEAPCNRLLFVTDPLCSWCWATLPHVLRLREQYQDRLECDLLMAGLQVGKPGYLNEFESRRLQRVWQEVRSTTGVELCGIIPEGFTYHSEKPCLAVQAARQLLGEAPWDFFHAMQRAFYIEGQDIRSDGVLASLAAEAGVDAEQMFTLMATDRILSLTRSEFDTAGRLGAHALPSILLDQGDGPKLMSGGYITDAYLREMLDQWLMQP